MRRQGWGLGVLAAAALLLSGCAAGSPGIVAPTAPAAAVMVAVTGSGAASPGAVTVRLGVPALVSP